MGGVGGVRWGMCGSGVCVSVCVEGGVCVRGCVDAGACMQVCVESGVGCVLEVSIVVSSCAGVCVYRLCEFIIFN